MTNEQAYKMIGERAEELTNNTEVQKKWLKLQTMKKKKKLKVFFTN